MTNFLGVIADTHGLLRPEAVAALQGADCIIHAGDVGNPEILTTLRTIAPLYVVLYFNPGSAGPRRFKLPITLGRLTIETGQLQAEIVALG